MGNSSTTNSAQNTANNNATNSNSATNYGSNTGSATAQNTANTSNTVSASGPSQAGQALINQATNPQNTIGNISSFMSPYTQNVLNSQLALENQQNGVQQQQLAGNAISQGALGGSRDQMQAAMLAGQQNLANNATNAGILQSGYGQALQAAQNTAGQQLQGAGLAGTQSSTGTQQLGSTAGQQASSTMGGTATGQSSATAGTGATSGSSTTQQNPGVMSYVGLAAGLLSDERVKENIEPIGKTYDGQTIHKFNYVGNPTTHIGLLAQEVQKHQPHAVHSIAGLKFVDYDAATNKAADKGHFATGGAVQGFDTGGSVSDTVPITYNGQTYYVPKSLLSGSQSSSTSTPSSGSGAMSPNEAFKFGQSLNSSMGNLFKNANNYLNSSLSSPSSTQPTASLGNSVANDVTAKSIGSGASPSMQPTSDLGTNVGNSVITNSIGNGIPSAQPAASPSASPTASPNTPPPGGLGANPAGGTGAGAPLTGGAEGAAGAGAATDAAGAGASSGAAGAGAGLGDAAGGAGAAAGADMAGAGGGLGSLGDLAMLFAARGGAINSHRRLASGGTAAPEASMPSIGSMPSSSFYMPVSMAPQQAATPSVSMPSVGMPSIAAPSVAQAQMPDITQATTPTASTGKGSMFAGGGTVRRRPDGGGVDADPSLANVPFVGSSGLSDWGYGQNSTPSIGDLSGNALYNPLTAPSPATAAPASVPDARPDAGPPPLTWSSLSPIGSAQAAEFPPATAQPVDASAAPASIGGMGSGFAAVPGQAPSPVTQPVAGGLADVPTVVKSESYRPDGTIIAPTLGTMPAANQEPAPLVGRQAVAGSIRDELSAAGMSDNAIRGVMANVKDESGFDPTLRHPDQPNFGGEAHFAHGLYQEGGAEWNNYQKWIDENHAGADWRDPKLQTQFLAKNLKENYPTVWKTMNEGTPEEAAQAFVSGYLKPAAQYESARRNQYSQGVPTVEDFINGAAGKVSSGIGSLFNGASAKPGATPSAGQPTLGSIGNLFQGNKGTDASKANLIEKLSGTQMPEGVHTVSDYLSKVSPLLLAVGANNPEWAKYPQELELKNKEFAQSQAKLLYEMTKPMTTGKYFDTNTYNWVESMGTLSPEAREAILTGKPMPANPINSVAGPGAGQSPVGAAQVAGTTSGLADMDTIPSTVTGDDFATQAKKIGYAPQMVDIAKQVADYKFDPNKLMVMKDQQRAAVVRMAHRINPDYDMAKYPAVADTEKKLASGDVAKALRSIGRLFDETSQASDLADATHNTKYETANWASAGVYPSGSEYGQAHAKLSTALNNVYDTASAVAKGGGQGAEGDAKRRAGSMNPNQAPVTLKGALAVEAEVGLKNGQSNLSSWNTAHGYTPDNPKYKTIMDYMTAAQQRKAIDMLGADKIEEITGKPVAMRPFARPGDAPATKQPIRVNSPEEAMKLPSGTPFVTPDGRVKVRP